MQVGDEVRYIPHECHALNRNAAGDYPWVLGRRYQVMEGGELVDKVEELHGRRVHEYIGYLQRHPDPTRERKNLVLVRPAAAWQAVVTAVNDNGTVDLDVRSNHGGVTLHYKGVPLDQTRAKAHSCHGQPPQDTGPQPKRGDQSQDSKRQEAQQSPPQHAQREQVRDVTAQHLQPERRGPAPQRGEDK